MNKDLILNILQGSWNLKRHVKEFKISMMGTANFVSVDEYKFTYEEYGNYSYQKTEYNFFQKYQFVMQANQLLIIKNDGSILHEFTLPDIENYPVMLIHTHNCGNDTYECQLIVHTINFFQIFYIVKGANKNYSINTDFTRV
jgi:hypothetical protein